MRWERVQGLARAKETPEGRKSAGRTGGIWGPGRRWGHTCNAVRSGRLLYVFAGYGADTSQTNDVHVFDTVKQTWCKPMVKGNPPSPRDSHSCTTVGNKLFVFGGTDGSCPLNDLHILDTSTNQWIAPDVSGEAPSAREGHAAALVGKRIFIFGGCGKSINNPEEVYYNDLYILDTESLAWEHARTFGTSPCPRDSHTCSAWGNKIIVFGGEDSSDCYLSDVHMLDTENFVWKQINTSGQMIAPRAGHVTVSVGSNLFVFGGFTDARNLYDDLHVLNVENGTWRRIICENQGPSRRFSVAGDCLDESKGIIVFIGGCNESLEALDDMYYLHTDIVLRYGVSEQRSSIRRELKNKRRDNPQAAKEPRTEDMHMYLQGCSNTGIQSGSSSTSERITFEARIVESNQYAYTIETTVNGQKLRGVIIASTSGSIEESHAYPNKKRAGIDVEGTSVNDSQSVLNAAAIISQEFKSSGQEQVDIAREKESTACVQPMEILGVNSTTSLQPNEATGNSESSPMLTDDHKNYSQNMEPLVISSTDMKNDIGDTVQLLKPSDELKNDPNESDKVSHNNEENLDPLPVNSEDLKDLLGNFPPTEMLDADVSENMLSANSELPVKIDLTSENSLSAQEVKEVKHSASCEGSHNNEDNSDPLPVNSEELKDLLGNFPPVEMLDADVSENVLSANSELPVTINLTSQNLFSAQEDKKVKHSAS